MDNSKRRLPNAGWEWFENKAQGKFYGEEMEEFGKIRARQDGNRGAGATGARVAATRGQHNLHRYPDGAKLLAASVFRRNVVFRNLFRSHFLLFGIGSTFHAAHYFGLIGLAFFYQFRDTLGIGVRNR